MDVSFQVKEVADTIGAFTSGQLKELGDYLKNHYCLYLGTVPQDVDIVHRAAMRGGCSEGQLVVNDLTAQRPQHYSHPADSTATCGAARVGPARTVILESYLPAKKINVIKVMRELTGMGLAEAKHAVENTPYLVAKAVPPSLADQARQKLVDAGGVVVVH